jgi:hypothetical protein
MARLIQLGLLAVGVIVVIVAAVVLGFGRSSEPSGSLTLTYQGPGQRAGEYAGFDVTFTNTTPSDVSNPQGRALAKVGEKVWPCQGYDDPVSNTPVYVPSDLTDHPLVIGAGKVVPVTILCRMPEAPMDSTEVWLR